MENYYLVQSPRLLRYFDWVMKRLRSSFVVECGDDLTDEILEKSRIEFEKIIPELPYIGGRGNLFTPFLIAAGGILAISRVINAVNKTPEAMFVLFYKAIDKSYNLLPKFIMRLLGRIFLSRYGGIAILRWQAARSQKRRFSEDWLFTVTKGDGVDFDWALEYTECAVIKFWEAQGANDLMPYCNFGDMAMSKVLGLGMESSTIGEGCETCVAKLKLGRETETRDWLPIREC